MTSCMFKPDNFYFSTFIGDGLIIKIHNFNLPSHSMTHPIAHVKMNVKLQGILKYNVWFGRYVVCRIHCIGFCSVYEYR